MSALWLCLGVSLAVGGFICGAVALASMVLAARTRQPGMPGPRPFEGPFDVLYRPSLLTPAGLRHRRRCFLAVVGLLGCGLLGSLGALLD